ncbi:hypothetical protein OPQ81_010425 [Rhizoctonia solani]|nr:hypothetical protein OPQ81_010425 [Rhizoctonia solani]
MRLLQSNILVNSDETALICDFGRSREPTDSPNEVMLSSSSPFAGTVRYMSPELLVPDSARPSPAADMWAYGCVALEILCRIQPYNETTSDVVVAELIRSGRLPSDRPRGPRGSLINDTLWIALSSCWKAQDWRPKAQEFLEQLNRMLQSGAIPRSPLPMDLFRSADNEPIPPWPHEIKDLIGQLNENTFAVRSRSLRSTVWRARTLANQSVVIKVPRLNASLDNHARHDHLEKIFRKVVSNRYGVHHPNIIDFLGITSGFSPHEGLVLEACYEWSLAEYRKKRIVMQEEYTRSTDPYPTSHGLMCDILEGLRYMHGYPIPISHGDLTPENISVDDRGRAKISIFSFGRMLAALPLDLAVTATVESVLSFRWMSPELVIANSPRATTESDMWTFGCVCFWLLTLQEPYDSISRDELAGAAIMRGLSPATLARVYQRDSWTTNGDVASAPSYLHEHTGGSIAHGDVHPKNIFVLPDGRAKLANFTCAFQYISTQPTSSREWSEPGMYGVLDPSFSVCVLRNFAASTLDITWRSSTSAFLPLIYKRPRGIVTPRVLGGTNDITKFVQVSRVAQGIYEEAGLGGSADIFSGTYTKDDGDVAKVAIKCIRAFNMEKNVGVDMERLQKKLLRELDIWRTLSRGANIIRLLGIINGIGPLPSFVCELCLWNLQDYLERKTPPPRHTKMMADTLRGLCYMHGLETGPIAHGDMKLSNILVNSHETALICDFGRSRKSKDRPNEPLLSSSSAFAGTVRYMSPELLVPESAVPSPAADMWAYGCISLEILGRIQPYNETASDVVVAELIRGGRPPSDRPHGPRGRLDWRPTAQGFLTELNRMLDMGEVSNSPLPVDLFAIRSTHRRQIFFVYSRSPRATIWKATTVTGQPVVVKVPRLNARVDNQARHDHLEYIFRKVVSSRYGIHHRNIIDLLGITSGFSPHEGLVFEECYEWRLDESDPFILKLRFPKMCDILEGLRYMHGYPIPIPHGGLTPENISVDDSGRAKISLMNFGGMLGSLPLDPAVTGTVESVLSFRWMSPELVIANSPRATTESDMWTFGCVCFWLMNQREPYSSIKRDDLAGAEIIRGHPPATLSRADYREFWTTNGLWSTIARCWRQDPLQRPTATEFMKFLT